MMMRILTADLRNLTTEEIKAIIKFYNYKYHINLKYYDGEDKYAGLNKNILTLAEGQSFTAIVSMRSHAFTVKFAKKDGDYAYTIDDSYAILNTIDYPVSRKSKLELETFSYAKEDFDSFFKILHPCKTLYINREKYQYDIGSCATYALVNAEILAQDVPYFEQTKKQFCSLLNRDVFSYDPTPQHDKYRQCKEDARSVYNIEKIPIDKKTAELREKALTLRDLEEKSKSGTTTQNAYSFQNEHARKKQAAINDENVVTTCGSCLIL